MKIMGTLAMIIAISMNLQAQEVFLAFAAPMDTVSEPEPKWEVYEEVVERNAFKDIEVEMMSNSLAKLTKLNGKVFTTNGKNKKDLELGFTVSDIAEVFPEIIAEDQQGYQYVNYNELVPIMVEAIKEQQVVIMELTKNLEVLYADWAKLEAIQDDIEQWETFLLTSKPGYLQSNHQASTLSGLKDR
jgi:hypothetical protein